MKALVSCAESRLLDARTRDQAALQPLQLMEKASLRLYDALRAWAAGLRRADGSARFPGFPSGARLVALCGRGDNGADAMAILRHAAFDAGAADLLAIHLDIPEGSPQAAQAGSLDSLGVPRRRWDASCAALLDEADIVLDGILGSGVKSAPRGEALDMIRACGQARKPLVVSIDLPSGSGDAMESGRLTVHADLTLCLSPLKTALYVPGVAARRGTVAEVRGVFPADGADAVPEAFLLEATDLGLPAGHAGGGTDSGAEAGLDSGALRRRRLASATAYKTRRGRVAVFAGSPGAAGAAWLCADAALRAGAGYVAVFADDRIASAIARRAPELMVRPRKASGFDPGDWDLVLAGPGWGRGPDREGLLAELLESGLPLVLDADAIAPYLRLAREGRSKASRVVLTPHPGELRAAFGEDATLAATDPRAALAALALPEGAAIILKSHMTWLGIPGELPCVWEGMEEALAIAGSGDVLAGLLAGIWASLIAQGDLGDQESGEAANRDDATRALAMRRAVIAHGLAGKRLHARQGWFTARSIAVEAGRILGGGTG